MLRQDNMKPQSVTHEIKTRWDPKKGKMVAQSQRYANRITPTNAAVCFLLILILPFLTLFFSENQSYLGS